MAFLGDHLRSIQAKWLGARLFKKEHRKRTPKKKKPRRSGAMSQRTSTWRREPGEVDPAVLFNARASCPLRLPDRGPSHRRAVDGVVQSHSDVRLTNRDSMHLSAVGAVDLHGCRPTCAKAVWVGLDSGGCLLVCCRTEELQCAYGGASVEIRRTTCRCCRLFPRQELFVRPPFRYKRVSPDRGCRGSRTNDVHGGIRGVFVPSPSNRTADIHATKERRGSDCTI
jgi:hypothetical protein